MESSPLVTRDGQWHVSIGGISDKPTKLLLKKESAWNMQMSVVPAGNTLFLALEEGGERRREKLMTSLSLPVVDFHNWNRLKPTYGIDWEFSLSHWIHPLSKQKDIIYIFSKSDPQNCRTCPRLCPRTESGLFDEARLIRSGGKE